MVIQMISKLADERQANLYKKMPSGHFLGNESNMDHFFRWNTFFRRNLHRVATDYLGIRLHIYQILVLYLMGICQTIVIVACRAAAKSFIIALYACCKCIVTPGYKIVLSSATKGQSKLIISEKIKGELMQMSPMLRKEIKNIINNQNDVIIEFQSGSMIRVVPANDNARGPRTNAIIREEFRMIDKYIEDSVLSPMQYLKQAPYMTDPFYEDKKEVKEEATDIYISSSWFDNGHWMWKLVDDTCEDMLNHKKACVLAFDEATTLKWNIKSMKQLQREKRKQDDLTWRIEFLNERVKENTSAFFTYAMLTRNQRLKQIFYPRSDLDVRAGKKNKFAIAKLPDELRAVCCDMAFIQNKKNDNSSFSCMRFIPESLSVETETGKTQIVNAYRRQVPYMTAVQGGDTYKQALIIRRLYEDFDADYIVLDLKNAGISIYDTLAKVMYDEERKIEYPPLKCMNNQDIANRIKINGAKECIYVINATKQLNTDIANAFRNTLENNMIDLLINHSTAVEEILPDIKEYVAAPDADTQLFYENPFIETQMMISETSMLISERDLAGNVTVREQGNNRKDRYTSVSYGNYFCSQLELDLVGGNDDYEFGCFVN